LVRPETRRTLIGLLIAGFIGALMLPFVYYSVVMRLAPPRPVPATSHAQPLVVDALWARADGGRATELKALNPINMAQFVLCSERAQRERDETLRRASRAQCQTYLPALPAMEYLSDLHLRDAGLEKAPFRRGHARLVTTIWLTRSWTKAELVDTLAERGEFGSGFRGVEAAAHGYFGRAAAQLTLPQAAMVAAFLADRGTDPWCDPAAAAGMRHRILQGMRDNNAIDEQAFGAADSSELGLTAPPANHKPCKG
jgi:hypothetical protein